MKPRRAKKPIFTSKHNKIVKKSRNASKHKKPKEVSEEVFSDGDTLEEKGLDGNDNIQEYLKEDEADEFDYLNEEDELYEKLVKENEELDEEDLFGENEDFEEPEEEGNLSSNIITLTMLEKWEEEIQNDKTCMAVFKNLQSALIAAVESIKGKGHKRTTNFVVKGSEVFNGIIRLCLNEVAPTLHKLFNLKTLSDRPSKNAAWKVLIVKVKKYLKALVHLVDSMTEPTVLLAILNKGILPLVPLYSEFEKINWLLTRQMATLWCTSDEKVRVISLIVLLRQMRSYNSNMREWTLKKLYISYVKNSHFTSPTTWPSINFMRMSLAELYELDHELAYRHGFIYIRQLALHLRSALLQLKEERLRLVGCWQFVHCLHFWAEFLGKTHSSPILQPLIYPVTQICIGTLDLLKSPKYFPLRFHICNIMTELSSKTNKFIPVLPYLLEIFDSSNWFRTRPKKTSVKPLEWECIIKVSQGQMKESSFSYGLIDQFVDCALRNLSSQCYSIAFPELVFPFVLQLKKYLKKCKLQECSRKLKHLLDKIEANKKFIDEKRKNVTFKLTDEREIKNFEIEVRQSGPPLLEYYEKWKGMRDDIVKREQGIVHDGFDHFSIRALKKRKRESDEDDDDEDEKDIKELPQSKKGKRNKIAVNNNKNKMSFNQPKEERDLIMENKDDDIVKEMKLSDYEESDGHDEDDGDGDGDDYDELKDDYDLGDSEGEV